MNLKSTNKDCDYYYNGGAQDVSPLDDENSYPVLGPVLGSLLGSTTTAPDQG